MKKILITFLKKIEILSAVSCRLTKLTGKSSYPIHPKHLIIDKLWLLRYLKVDDNVLDLGCGVGAISLKIAKKVKFVTGVDVSEDSLKIANGKKVELKMKNVLFSRCDANKRLPFKDKIFDKVICSDVLEHLNKRDFAIKEIRRVLKPKGLLLLVADNPDTSWKKQQKSVGVFHYADSDHKYEYPKDEILKKIEKQKFKIMSISGVTYDTPLTGLIDLVGGLSLPIYRRLRQWRIEMAKKYPEETTGFRIVAQKYDY